MYYPGGKVPSVYSVDATLAVTAVEVTTKLEQLTVLGDAIATPSTLVTLTQTKLRAQKSGVTLKSTLLYPNAESV